MKISLAGPDYVRNIGRAVVWCGDIAVFVIILVNSEQPASLLDFIRYLGKVQVSISVQ